MTNFIPKEPMWTEPLIDGYTEAEIISMMERVCSEPGCDRWCLQGCTLCVGHLHEFPRKVPDDKLKLIAKYKLLKGL